MSPEGGSVPGARPYMSVLIAGGRFGGKMGLVNLHNHSNFSFLDGMSRIEEMVLRAKELGQSSLALTDHGVMTGIIPFYKSCHKYGVKPIIGMEAYFTRDLTAKSRSSSEVNSHLILLAMNNVGYRNLLKLASLGFSHFYHKPRICLADLDTHREGIFITTACLASPFRKAWLDKEISNPWEESVEGLIEIFHDNMAAETQTYEHNQQYDYNEIVREEAARRGIPVIVTSDCHYTRREDFDAHDLMLAIQSRKDFDDPKRMRHDCNTLYLHSEKEILSLGFPEEEIANTQAIAERCNVELDFSIKFPRQRGALGRIRNICNCYRNWSSQC